ncbi:MAG: cytochrome c3 family protein [Bacteroidales bacterium]|nr:cytochrome c3 family protein [Bacteroidales bacterium]
MKKLIITVFIFLIAFMVLAQTGTETKSCIDCHANLMEHNVKHEVATDDCENCHMANGNEHPQEGVKGFDLGDQVPALCFMCHEENTKSNIHPPAEEECLMCHSPHSSANMALLTFSPPAVLCADCHEMEMTQKPVKHKPVEDGFCSDCHDPHQSEFSSFLKAEKPQLCMNCHVSQQMQTGLKNIHLPFEDDCANCHETHSADVEKLLIQQIPDLCYNCHDTPIPENARVVHKVVNDEKGCANCHSPHASEYEMLLIKNGKDLCLSRHSKTIKTEDKILANIGKLLKKGNVVHGAIEGDGCTVCHNPHASEQPLLLNAAFPTGQYVAATVENFDLCFICHDSEILIAEFSTTATNFRNGDQNLHYLHINGEKGRNCNVCHNVHGAANEHLISEKVKFGNWEMPVQFKIVENGGSCNTGCHAEKTYLR